MHLPLRAQKMRGAIRGKNSQGETYTCRLIPGDCAGAVYGFGQRFVRDRSDARPGTGRRHQQAAGAVRAQPDSRPGR
ncbi:hypothetical protein GCM10010344_39100 [Streptomyces bluensis]|nr:hypothetical protein GCM10010344_39100 [Streptomyces bluensis]